ncbi:MAG: hypothetical protein WAW31_06230 [Smithella sp.]
MTNRIKLQKGQDGTKINAGNATKDVSADDAPPIFSLKISKKYCITACTSEEQKQFALTLHQLSQSPWSDLRQAGRHGTGYEIIPKKIIKGATIPEEVTKDVHIIAFRFSGKKPMVGYRDALDRRIFHILWLDRKFCLYNHGS